MSAVCDEHGRICEKFEQAKEWHQECTTDRAKIHGRIDDMREDVRDQLNTKTPLRLFYVLVSILVMLVGGMVAQQHGQSARQTEVNSQMIQALTRIEIQFESHVQNYERERSNKRTYGIGGNNK
jgi:hypothetical protein